MPTAGDAGAAGDNGTPASQAVHKRVSFEGLRVELFENIDDPTAAAESNLAMSHMLEAAAQLAGNLSSSGILVQVMLEHVVHVHVMYMLCACAVVCVWSMYA